MMERLRAIFGNQMTEATYRSAVKSKKKYAKKFGDETNVNYPVELEKKGNK